MGAAATILSILILLSSGIAKAQDDRYSGASIDLTDSKGIIHQLAPGDVAPERFDVDPAHRAEVIQILSKAKRDETGWHKQLAIYFLICLDQNYSENVRDLLRILQNPKNEDTEETMDLIIKIYRQGHSELLKTIMKAGPRSDGAWAEELGTFFEEELVSHPREFVSVLPRFSVADQKEICRLAGGTDGGGLPPGDEVRISRKLAMLQSSIADRCARNVRNGNRGTHATNP